MSHIQEQNKQSASDDHTKSLRPSRLARCLSVQAMSNIQEQIKAAGVMQMPGDLAIILSDRLAANLTSILADSVTWRVSQTLSASLMLDLGTHLEASLGRCPNPDIVVDPKSDAEPHLMLTPRGASLGRWPNPPLDADPTPHAHAHTLGVPRSIGPTA